MSIAPKHEHSSNETAKRDCRVKLLTLGSSGRKAVELRQFHESLGLICKAGAAQAFYTGPFLCIAVPENFVLVSQ
jgi:hypothetical protein